ncbi:2OG-Fe(II) oxygenase [Mesorhizobium sp. BR1-1-16]|uniref:2OG-Fe(II) oxygenase n=1 Tax=Mesorhizobium sp. BR1-1-16 TaxID=2876653 RepID=UPI001CCAAF45|nr:2OG-Fe(II) oxygenase [Mesorhizobium sp. BR1-1-16]MBZ9939441.1 2OG-Fe(II) oxygenase [Mesorhizobium sp. BR1-1-16]
MSGAAASCDASPALDALMEQLVATGYAVADDVFPVALAARLRAELLALQAAGSLSIAGVGREAAYRRDGNVRRASIRWLDGGTAAEQALLDFAETLRRAINARLFLGLFDFECNYIAYPVGGFYGRHLDSLEGARNRVVSFVGYLDPDWGEADGGALRLWRDPADLGEPVTTVLPQVGRMVLMLSEDIPHEVLPAHRPRHAVAGWWRINRA